MGQFCGTTRGGRRCDLGRLQKTHTEEASRERSREGYLGGVGLLAPHVGHAEPVAGVSERAQHHRVVHLHTLEHTRSHSVFFMCNRGSFRS